jgi:hypothetical protein
MLSAMTTPKVITLRGQNMAHGPLVWHIKAYWKKPPQKPILTNINIIKTSFILIASTFMKQTLKVPLMFSI